LSPLSRACKAPQPLKIQADRIFGPYGVDTYAGDDYAKSVREVLAMYDTVAPQLTEKQRARCKELFVISARYEYQFWDMTWREERWLP